MSEPTQGGPLTFVCMSTASTPRYRRNILRSLAQPTGSRLQYRYREELVSPEVKALIDKKKITGMVAVIAHIDTSTHATLPDIIPCRFARVAETDTAGTTIAVNFVLEGFAHPKDMSAFRELLQTNALGERLPTFKPDLDDDTKGSYGPHFWIGTKLTPEELTGAMSGNLETSILGSVSRRDWEQIVDQIARRPAFTGEFCFYTIQGVYKLGGLFSSLGFIHNKLQPLEGGLYDLSAARDYEMQIYHYYPDESPWAGDISSEGQHHAEDNIIEVAAANDVLQFTTNTQLPIDSPYDIKRVRFRTSRPLNDNRSILSIYRKYGQDGPRSLDFDIEVKVKKGTYNLMLGAIIGFLLGIPHFLETLSKIAEAMNKEHTVASSVPAPHGIMQSMHVLSEINILWAAGVGYLILYIVAGMIAAAGLKKGLTGE